MCPCMRSRISILILHAAKDGLFGDNYSGPENRFRRKSKMSGSA